MGQDKQVEVTRAGTAAPVDVLAVLDADIDRRANTAAYLASLDGEDARPICARENAERAEAMRAARGAIVELIALAERMANPGAGELLTLDDYRQIARNTLTRVGGAA